VGSASLCVARRGTGRPGQQDRPVGTAPDSRQDQRLAYLRNAVEHSDEKLLGKQHGKSPAFDRADPYSPRLANTSMVIGKNVLTYKELVSIMTKCHKTVEVIRRGPTGTPGPAFPNARLRTDPGNPVTAPGGCARPPTSRS
jgi:hypothetical protein